MSGTTNVPEVTVLIRDGKNILFVLRQNTGYADGMYAMPGGHVEPDENFTDAGVREAMEEVGVSINPRDLKPLHTLHRVSKPGDVRIGVLFEATTWTGQPHNREPERHGEIAWFNEDSLPYDKIIGFQAEALRSLADGNHYGELGWN
jgi:8-oxo-dGTP diphosphatase